jgi:hypothetical protein
MSANVICCGADLYDTLCVQNTDVFDTFLTDYSLNHLIDRCPIIVQHGMFEIGLNRCAQTIGRCLSAANKLLVLK